MGYGMDFAAGQLSAVGCLILGFPQYAIHSNYAGLWSEQKQTRVAQQTLWLGEGCAIELPLAGPADG